MHRERPSRIAGAVVWTATSDGTPRRILPDGCMDLIWMDDEIVIAGPDVRAFEHACRPGAQLTGLRFAPGYAPGVLGVPAHEFLNARVPLAAVWPHAKVDALVDQLTTTTRPGAVLEEVAKHEYTMWPWEAGLLATIVCELQHGRSVSDLAETTGISARQLQRKSTRAFGYGPKMLTRILRMVRALDLARNGTPFAEVAYSAGDSDHAHLARDVNEFSGTTLRQLL